MDFGKAFTYVFEDSEWVKKLGIAGLLNIIPILGTVLVSGWALNTTRNVIRREEQPLADWSDFGDIIIKGLLVFVIGFVYAIPIILINACNTAFNIGLAESNDDTVASALIFASICFGCLSFLYGIFLAFVIPAALGNFAAKDQFGAAFRFGEVFGLLRSAPGPYILVVLGGILAGFIAMLGLIACIIGVFFTIAYAAVVNGHLQGQAYNAAMEAQGAQAEAAF